MVCVVIFFKSSSFPLIIALFSDPKQHQATYCLIEHSSDGAFVLKALKQKLYVDNLAYLLQDIYGIENKLVHVRVII